MLPQQSKVTYFQPYFRSIAPLHHSDGVDAIEPIIRQSGYIGT
jgi:hypothetical protein